MLIVRGILLAPPALQKHCLTRGDKGSMYKDNNCLPKICGNLMMGLTSAGVNRLRTKKFHNLPQTPSGAQMSFILNHFLPLPFSPSFDIKEA